jgi:predicted N-acetyltransferase YhbS
MDVTLRPGRPDDAVACGTICYEAFKAIAERHHFVPDFPSAEAAIGIIGTLLSHPGFYGVVAELDGRVVGSNFLDERSTIAGLGPITVEPSVQDRQIGRALMAAALGRAASRRCPGVRLVQAAYHTRSLALYTKLGFVAREPLVVLQGPVIRETLPGYTVRPAREEDLPACNGLCVRVHGVDRSGELHDALSRGTAAVVEHDGRITGYTTGVAFLGHTVGVSNNDLRALIGSAPAYGGPGFLVPARNADLVRWCLDHGLRIGQIMTLMSLGLYHEPEGAWLPSVLC